MGSPRPGLNSTGDGEIRTLGDGPVFERTPISDDATVTLEDARELVAAERSEELRQAVMTGRLALPWHISEQIGESYPDIPTQRGPRMADLDRIDQGEFQALISSGPQRAGDEPAS